MDDLTATGRESLVVGASAFRAAVRAWEAKRPGAEASLKRVARGLQRLAQTYHLTAVELAARDLNDCANGALAECVAGLVSELDRQVPSSR